MSGDDDLDDLLGPAPVAVVPEELAPITPSRALLNRSRSYPTSYASKKRTPERLLRILSYAAEMPVTSTVATRAGISNTCLKYWLQKSKDGAPGDGFDMPLPDDEESGTPNNTVRFHEAWDLAMTAGVELVEAATLRRAIGYLEPLTYQGRVQYRWDYEKVALSVEMGLPEYVPANYLLDEFGAPVPETVEKMDPDLAMFILKARKPNIYGPKQQLDVNFKGGVLVVGTRAVTAEALNIAEQEFRREGRPAVTFEEGDDEDGA